MAALDTNVFDKVKTFDDYQRLEQEFQLKKQLAAAQIGASQAALLKAQQPDINQIGEQAFLKASQGIPLSPIETGALQFLDAKQQNVVFNPATGAREEKPSLLARAGLGVPQQAAPTLQPRSNQQPMSQGNAAQIVDLFGGDGQPIQDAPSEWDAAFQQQMQAAAGNPKLQQTIRSDYAKAKISMTEAEAKNAGFADRMNLANPIIEQTKNASMDLGQVTKGNIPLVGNYLVNDDYQSATQAQKDFLNSILRRESGAVISPSEFKNGKEQYFPQPGDSEQVLLQKAANRESALGGIRRSAGPSYKPTVIKNPNLYDKADSDFKARKIATPDELAEYKKLRGNK